MIESGPEPSRRLDRLHLLASFVAVLGVFYALYLHPQHRNDPIDTLLATTLGIGFSLAAVVQLVATGTWTVRSIGLFFVLIGDAVLYSSIAYRAWTNGPQVSESATDLSRSFFIVGMPMLVVSLVSWWAARKENRRDTVASGEG